MQFVAGRAVFHFEREIRKRDRSAKGYSVGVLIVGAPDETRRAPDELPERLIIQTHLTERRHPQQSRKPLAFPFYQCVCMSGYLTVRRGFTWPV